LKGIKMKKLIVLFILLMALPADGDEMFPKKSWFAKPNPMADSKASRPTYSKKSANAHRSQ